MPSYAKGSCRATVLADSISSAGKRLVTFEVTFPRKLLAEVNTHRVAAKNTSSSRAIPVTKVIEAVKNDPFLPRAIGLAEPGMQSSQFLDKDKTKLVQEQIRALAMNATATARHLLDVYGLHKQVINRYLEPWLMVTQAISFTDIENFFAQRCHPTAEPDMRVLAWCMADVYYRDSKPVHAPLGSWHLPYVTEEERARMPIEMQKKISVARLARTSYRLDGGFAPDPEKELSIFDKLLAGLLSEKEDEPLHMTPFEHVATPSAFADKVSGCFRGWEQYRHEFAREQTGFSYDRAIAAGWRDMAYGPVS